MLQQTEVSKAFVEQMNVLAREARRLAVIGAALMTADEEADASILKLRAAADAAMEGDLAAVSPEEARAAKMTAEMAIAEAGDILRHPNRKGPWNVEDPYLLHKQGQASRQAFRQIMSFAEERPALLQALSKRFLDVGTGVGAIALEAAASCPVLTIDGIDIWEPSLEYARKNVAASPYKDRINILKQDVTTLPPIPRYSVMWLPTMFLRPEVVKEVLTRLVQAAVPGAYLICGTYTDPVDPFDAAFVDLRRLRSGGDTLRANELERLLAEMDFVDIASTPKPMSTYTIARRPDKPWTTYPARP
jgi:SAM-dependent methyltransferase